MRKLTKDVLSDDDEQEQKNSDNIKLDIHNLSDVLRIDILDQQENENKIDIFIRCKYDERVNIPCYPNGDVYITDAVPFFLGYDCDGLGHAYYIRTRLGGGKIAHAPMSII